MYVHLPPHLHPESHFYVGESKNSLSTRMNGHQSSSNNPYNLPLLVAIHTKSHQLPFNPCWNVHVLYNVPLALITSPAAILNVPINSFCILDTLLVLISDDIHQFPLHPLHLPVLYSHW
jgi:hypothetical protein